MKVNNNDGLWNKGGDADVHQLVQVQLQIASAVEKKNSSSETEDMQFEHSVSSPCDSISFCWTLARTHVYIFHLTAEKTIT